jgi:hypothetical protein
MKIKIDNIYKNFYVNNVTAINRFYYTTLIKLFIIQYIIYTMYSIWFKIYDEF